MRSGSNDFENNNNSPISTPEDDASSLLLAEAPNPTPELMSEKVAPEAQSPKPDTSSQSLPLGSSQKKAEINRRAWSGSLRREVKQIGLYRMAYIEQDGSEEDKQQASEFFPLVVSLSPGLKLGKSVPNADRLFDAVSQALAKMQIKGNSHTIKSLRKLCCDYLKSNAVFLADQALYFDPDFIERLQYTVEEAEKKQIEPVGGNIGSMGKILSCCLNITIHCVAISDKTPENGPIHYYIDGAKITAVHEEGKNLYQRANTIHLVVYNGSIGNTGHIVPILPKIPFSFKDPVIAEPKQFSLVSNPAISLRPDALFFDRIIMLDDETLSSAGHNERYYYSVGDMYCLMQSIRKKNLRYTDKDGKVYEIRGNESYFSIRQNRSRIYLADPSIPETFKNSLLGDIQSISGVNQHAWKNVDLAEMPTLLIFPILMNASSRQAGHWYSVRVSISYDTRQVSVLWANPFGANAPFPPGIKQFITDTILETVKILFRVQTGETAFITTEMFDQLFDQQGLGVNSWDCGPITAQNIEDFVNGNIPNHQFASNPACLSIQSANCVGHQGQIKSVRIRHREDYVSITEDNLFSASVTNAKLGDVNQGLSRNFQAQWEQMGKNSECVRIFDLISSWPAKLVSSFFQKIYQSPADLNGDEPFSVELLQSAYQEMLPSYEKYLETQACVMAFQGDDQDAIDAVFAAFCLSKEEAVQFILENIEAVAPMLATAFQECFLKQPAEFIEYLEKLPEYKSAQGQGIKSALQQHQNQVNNSDQFSLRATAAQIEIFVHAHKEKLLPTFVRYNILEKTHQGDWPHALLLQSLAKLQYRKLYFWSLNISGKLECVTPEFSQIGPGENDLHLLRVDGRKFSVLDYAKLAEAAVERLKPVTHLFKFYDPNASTVHLAGSFNNCLDPVNGSIKTDEKWLMKKNEDDVWKCSVDLMPGVHEFKYVVNGESFQNDPDKNRYGISDGPGKNSVLNIPLFSGAVDLVERVEKEPARMPAGRSRASSRALLESPRQPDAAKPNLTLQKDLEALAFEAVYTAQPELLGLLLGCQLTPKQSLSERIVILKKELSSLEMISFETQNSFHAFKKLEFVLAQIENSFPLLTDPEGDVKVAWSTAAESGVQSISKSLSDDPQLTSNERMKIEDEARKRLFQDLERSKTEMQRTIEKTLLLSAGSSPTPPSTLISVQDAKKDLPQLQALQQEVSGTVKRLENELLKVLPRDSALILNELEEYEESLKAMGKRKLEYLEHIERQRKNGFMCEFKIPPQLILSKPYDYKENAQRKAFIQELRISPDITENNQENGKTLLSVAIDMYFNMGNFRLFHGYKFPDDFSKINGLVKESYFANVSWQNDGKLELYYYSNQGKFYKLDTDLIMTALPSDVINIAKQNALKPGEIDRGDGFIRLRGTIFDYQKKQIRIILHLLLQRGACIGSQQNEHSSRAIKFAATQLDRSPIDVIKFEMSRQTALLANMAKRYQLSPLVPQINKLLEAQDVITWYDAILHMNQSFSKIKLFFSRIGANLKGRAEEVALLMMNLRVAMAIQNPFLFVEAMEGIFAQVLKDGYRLEGRLHGHMLSIAESLKAGGLDQPVFLKELDRCLEGSAYHVRRVDSPEVQPKPEAVRRAASRVDLFSTTSSAAQKTGERKEETPKSASIENNNNI